MPEQRELKPCNCGTQPISESYHNKAWEVYCPNIDCIVVFVVRPTKELSEKAWNKHHERPTEPIGKEEKWNENVETCSGCGIQWKKIGRQCPVCYEPAETTTNTDRIEETLLKFKKLCKEDRLCDSMGYLDPIAIEDYFRKTLTQVKKG